MKSSNLLVLLMLFFFGGTISAQTIDEQKKQIASVKKSNLYIYGEATAETEQDARDLAEEILNYEINKWAANQKKLKGTANFVLNNRQELYTTMSLPRGDMFRSFMYVKKSDIQKGDNATIISSVGSASASNTTVAGLSSEVAEETAEVEETSNATFSPVAIELSGMSNYAEIAAKIMDYKENGKIKTYNYYAKLDNPSLYYLVMYNKDGVVEAVLSPGKPRKNVKTGNEDTTNNYPGCGAIGFMVND